MKAAYILWLRQLKRYSRSKTRIIGSLGQPILFLVALGLGFGPIYQKAGGGDYIQFLAPGVIAMGILFTSVFSGIEIIWDRQFGFLKETLVAPVSRLEIMIGRTLGGATVATMQGVVVLIISMFVNFHPIIAMIPAAILIMGLISIIFTALGTAIASLMDDMHGFQLIINFLIMPMFFLSGALFPLQNLPPTIQAISNLNPLSYGVDALRSLLTGAPAYFGLGADIAIMLAVATFFLTIGSYLFSKIQI